jgi:large subunit ribosomal protein L17
MRNLATALFLTERDDLAYEGLFQADGKTKVNPPAHKGRIVTTIQKAKEVKPLVEKCITIARKAIPHERAAEEFATSAERNSSEWKQWRESDNHKKWVEAIAPAVNARRRVFSMLRDKEAVSILFDDVAPRFEDRNGGYTRVMRLAKPRLGDNGTQAILEFVGKHDRVASASAPRPSFASDAAPAAVPAAAESEAAPAADEQPADDATATATAEAPADEAPSEESTES